MSPKSKAEIDPTQKLREVIHKRLRRLAVTDLLSSVELRLALLTLSDDVIKTDWPTGEDNED